MDLRDLVVLAGIVNPEMLNKLEPTAEVEEADGAGFEDATTRPEEAMMDDPMATMGSDVDLSLRRYLKAKGDHVTVDEAEVYPDYTVEDVTESYAAFKEGKVEEDDVDEGNAYTGALAKAKAAGDDEFEVDGKVHKVKEAAKPDYIDIDGDGDKEESMKKAAKDKEEDEEVDESLDMLKKLAGL